MSEDLKVWVLLGDKVGDNAQALSLARGWGYSFEKKMLKYRELRRLPNWLLGTSFWSLAEGEESLVAPWPDFVIGVGRRSAPIARGIKRLSGGKTRLIHLGRPRAPLAAFDLVVSTPQYCLPPHARHFSVDLPISTATRQEACESAVAEKYALRWGAEQQPKIALLVGGDAPPYRFDPETAAKLGEEACALAAETGAQLLITCGRRVSKEAADALRNATQSTCLHFHRFSESSDENPYLAYLAEAQLFVVTADSVSMMADVLAVGGELRLFTPPRRPSAWQKFRAALESLSRAVVPRAWREALVAKGLVVPLRRSELVASNLVDKGMARWLGSNSASLKRSEQASTLFTILYKLTETFGVARLGEQIRE
ncbi:MAG: ELM1/GtrOC1 family putative glycosyltransferase [Planctomycetota bacterium]